MNRVRNGEGGGWHARQAHAEQNIRLIEKKCSLHSCPIQSPFHHTPTPLIMYVQYSDIYLLSADDKGFGVTDDLLHLFSQVI